MHCTITGALSRSDTLHLVVRVFEQAKQCPADLWTYWDPWPWMGAEWYRFFSFYDLLISPVRDLKSCRLVTTENRIMIFWCWSCYDRWKSFETILGSLCVWEQDAWWHFQTYKTNTILLLLLLINIIIIVIIIVVIINCCYSIIIIIIIFTYYYYYYCYK